MMKPTHPRIESIEVIPMNKESIFEQPYSEFEMFACSLSYEDWASRMIPIMKGNPDEKIEGSFPGMGYDILQETRQIADKFKGFMWAPTAKYGTNVLMAKHKKFESIQQILDTDFSNCFLYTVGGQFMKYNTHPNPFDPTIDPEKYLEVMAPYTKEEYTYTIRYAEL